MSPYKAETFDSNTFLAESGLGRAILQYRRKKLIFTQGEAADAVFYIQKGRAKLTVLSTQGKEATIALLGEGDFIGEGCITSDQLVRIASAAAVTDCCVLRIKKNTMLSVLHREHSFSDLFVAYLVTRNNQTQADLIDQLFNSAEKRLARTLLLLAASERRGDQKPYFLRLASRPWLKWSVRPGHESTSL